VDGVYQESISLAGGRRLCWCLLMRLLLLQGLLQGPPASRARTTQPLAVQLAASNAGWPPPRPPPQPAAAPPLPRPAANSYYALSLLGVALNDTQMVSFGRLLLAMEVRAAHQYWYISSRSQVGLGGRAPAG
jgi:hypothetical protein